MIRSMPDTRARFIPSFMKERVGKEGSFREVVPAEGITRENK